MFELLGLHVSVGFLHQRRSKPFSEIKLEVGFFLVFLVFFFFWLHWALETFYHYCGSRIYLLDQGLDLGPLYWECGVLASGPPGKSQAGGF